jgi:hypothetical protein
MTWVIVGAQCCNIWNWGYCNTYATIRIDAIVATVGTETIVQIQWWEQVIVGTHGYNSEDWGHCWLTMSSNHIITTMTLDTTVAFVIPFKQEWAMVISENTFEISVDSKEYTLPILFYKMAVKVSLSFLRTEVLNFALIITYSFLF